MDIAEKIQQSTTEDALKRQRAGAYLKDLLEDSEYSKLEPTFIEIRKNELTLEILRAQQLRIEVLKDQNEKDAITLTDSINLLMDAAENQLSKLIEVRCKIADEVHKTHGYMQQLHSLSNSKEIDSKIKKFSELSSALVSISQILDSEKIGKIISILASK